MRDFDDWWKSITDGPLDFGLDERSARIGHDAGAAAMAIEAYDVKKVAYIAKQLKFRYDEHEAFILNERFVTMGFTRKFNKLKWKVDPTNERAVTIRNDALKEAYDLICEFVWPKKD